MFYDLNIPWTLETQHTLPRILAFAHELGYNVIALNHTISGALPKSLTCPIPDPLPQQSELSKNLTILRRVTLVLTESYQNARLAQLAKEYDILAVRPIDEAGLKAACARLECDLISLDFTQRYNFFFKHKMVNEAVGLGKRFEISYAAAVGGGGSEARRNLIGNVGQIFRALRGRGVVLSSGAGAGGGGVGMRAPWDVVNLAAVWGLGQERGVEGLGKEARGVVVRAQLKRTGYRGVVDVVFGGEKGEADEMQEEMGPQEKGKAKQKQKQKQVEKGEDAQQAQNTQQRQKRKADAVEGEGDGEQKLSNRQRKRLAHEARMQKQAEASGTASPRGAAQNEDSSTGTGG